MSLDVSVRTATLQDRAPLEALWLTFLEEQAALDDSLTIADDAIERWHNDFSGWVERDRRHIVVAEAGGTLAGFAAAVRWSPPPIFAYAREAYLEDFFVAPAYRRRGIGTTLYQAVREWAASWGAERIRLSVLAENASARPFWTRMGLRDLSVTMIEGLAAQGTASSDDLSRPIGFRVVR